MNQSPQRAIRTFEDLECWQQCRVLRLFAAREVLPTLPKEERYRLGDQLLRAARSSTANIAEGYGRFHFLENAKFCSNARASCWEVLDHLITGNDEALISDELIQRGREVVDQAVKLLNGYIRYLQRAQPVSPKARRTDRRQASDSTTENREPRTR